MADRFPHQTFASGLRAAWRYGGGNGARPFERTSVSPVVAEVKGRRMQLTRGSRVGVYEVIGLIGAGGMGEVYRARDTSLGRDVALKILTEIAVGDPDRQARFEQEARAIAA